MTELAGSRSRGNDAEFDYRPEQSVGFQLRSTYRAFGRVLQGRIAADNVTLAQWYFFRVLWERDGLTQRELSDGTGLQEPTTAAALRVMERRGFIRRARDTRDRRKTKVKLTKLGRRLKSKLLPFAAETNTLALRGIAEDDLAIFLRVLDRLRGNLEGVIGDRIGNDAD